MQRFTEGDRVRVDIPDETDPDHDLYHGEEGIVTVVNRDDAGLESGDERDSINYYVEFDDLENGMYFRWRDLRPPLPESNKKDS